MTPGRLDRLIHTATAGDDTVLWFVYDLLRGQELQRGIDVARHLVTRGSEVFVLRIFASAESAEVQSQCVVSRRAQHGPEVVVDLAIRVALMKQQQSRPG